MPSKLLTLLLCVGLTTLFTASAFSQSSVPIQAAGRILAVRVRGDIFMTVKATQERTPLTESAEVWQGSVVTTGENASVVLVFSNGATINLGADAELEVQEFTQDPFAEAFDAAGAQEEPTTSTTRLKMTRGELVGRVAKLNHAKGSSFNVSTPVGAAGIRGTIFRIVYRADAAGKVSFTLTTLEGRVEVTVASGSVTSPPVAVSANEEVAVTADITTNANGEIIITLPDSTGKLEATTASTGSMADIVAAAQEIAQAVADVVIVPPSESPPSTATPTNGEGDSTNSKASEETTTKTNSETMDTKQVADTKDAAPPTQKSNTTTTTPVVTSGPNTIIVSPSTTTN